MIKYFPYIVLVLLAVIMFQGFLNKPYDEWLQDYRNRIDSLTRDKIELMQANNDLELKINNFKYEIIKSDSIVSNATNEQLDSMFTNYFNR